MTDISREAVERLATWAEGAGVRDASECAAHLRALRDELDRTEMDAKVKPLEWYKNRSGDSIIGYDAKTTFGVYSCRYIGWGRWSLWFRERCLWDEGTVVRRTASLEKTKAAAQADYERRILAALALPYKPQEDVTDDNPQ